MENQQSLLILLPLIIAGFTFVGQLALSIIVVIQNTKLEKFKGEISKDVAEYQTRYSYYHQKQFDGLVEIYRVFHEFYVHIENFSKSEDIDNALLNKTIQTFNDNKLFIDSNDLNKTIGKAFFTLLRGADLNGVIWPEALDGKISPEKMRKLAQNAAENLPSIIKSLEDTIRGIINP